MKKVFGLLSLFLVISSVAYAQSSPAGTVVTLPSFSWAVLFQQLLTNGLGALIGFAVAQIPGIGTYLKQLVDILIGNLEHKNNPPAP